MSAIKHKNAIDELIISEEDYVKNLTTFSEDIYNSFDSCLFITADKKRDLLENAFINIKQITHIHITIFAELKRLQAEPNFITLFYRAFTENIDLFEEYLAYAKMLPEAQYKLTQELSEDEKLYTFSNEVLNQYNAQSLGFLHFLNNPLQKLTRYEILFQAIIKHEENESVKKNLMNIKKTIINFNTQINDIYKKSCLYFRIYLVYNSLKMPQNHPHKTILNLQSISRIIYKEGEIGMKFSKDNTLVKKYIFIFDHLTLICDLIIEENKPQYFLNKILEPWGTIIIDDDKNNELLPPPYKYVIILKNIIDNSIITLYFVDVNTRDIYLTAIQKMISACKNNYIPEIKIKKIGRLTQNYIYKVLGSNIDYWLQIKDEDLKATIASETCIEKEIIHDNIFEYYKCANLKSKLSLDFFEGNKKLLQAFINESCDNEIWDKFGNIGINDKQFVLKNTICFLNINKTKKFIIFSDMEGIHLKRSTKSTCISKDITGKIIHNKKHNYIIYLTENKLKIAQITHKTTELKPKIIDENVSNFFCLKENLSYLFTVKVENGEDRLFFNLINIDDDKCNIYNFSDLIIGERIRSIRLYENNFLIASKKFQIVSYNAMSVKNFLVADNTTDNNMLVLEKNNSARDIFKISKKLSLLCFTHSGHIFSSDGRTEYKTVVFRWGFIPIEFKTFERYLVVLGIKNISIYDIMTGVLLFKDTGKTFNFVFGLDRIFLNDSYFLYEIVLPKIK